MKVKRSKKVKKQLESMRGKLKIETRLDNQRKTKGSRYV